MDPLIAKLEKRFSPEFSKLLAKRIMNTPEIFGLKSVMRCHTDMHPINQYSNNKFIEGNSMDHIRQGHDEALKNQPKP